MNLPPENPLKKQLPKKSGIDRNPLNFLNHKRHTPIKRISDERKIDFKEIYSTSQEQLSAKQAARCVDCGNPYCEWKCPLHNYIPNWLELVAQENYQQAAELMYETNPLPEICGRVCPQDRLCEQACTLNTGFGAVTIGAIEKDITDMALAKQWRPELVKIESNKRVAVVGAGPAGIACADQLARNGIKAVVYDQYPEIGGLLTFGIPGFKLEKEVMRKRKAFLEDIGVEFKLNTCVGKDISFDQLKEQYDSIFLAMGTYKSVQANIPNIENKNVINALDYLIGNINHIENYQMVNYPYQNLKDKKVIVIGGGDTAMDCVRTAIRQGAESVSCVYRRDQESMPGSPREVSNAIEEGVEFLFNRSPVSVESNSDNKLIGLNVIATKQQMDSKSGKQQLNNVQGSDQLLNADTIITAFGFKASPARWFDDAGISVKENGLVKMTESLTRDTPYLQKTMANNVYAGGDMVRGADLVVTAVAEGIKAAQEIINDLSK